MFDVGRDLPPELAGVLLAEVDLVVGAAEPNRSIWSAGPPSRVVFEFNGDALRHRGLRACDGLSAPYKISRCR
jgi:hypothetical protein